MRPQNLVIFGLTLVCIILTIITCNSRKQLSSAEKMIQDLEIKSDHRIEPPETLYKKVYLPKSLGSSVKPSTVILPPSQSKSNRHEKANDITPDTSNPITKTDSVAAVELNHEHFKFTFQDSTGNLSSLDFKIQPSKYQYVWVDGKLTAKKLSIFKRVKFNPYLEVSYRPINNLTDIEAGIQLNSEHFHYGIGLNGFYYPKFQSQPGWDVRVNLKYQF